MSALNLAHCHSPSDAHHRVQSSLDARARQQALTELLTYTQQKQLSSLVLENGFRVAVIGGGPAGSFFSYFLLEIAERVGLKIQVDIHEPRDFGIPGPLGYNMCGDVLYESLAQSLAVEGINLPETVVPRGVERNMLHLDPGSVCIQTPRHPSSSCRSRKLLLTCLLDIAS